MQRTTLDQSIKEFNFEIYFLDYRSDVEEIDTPNYEDILYVKCYPKWDMKEKELINLIEKNKSFLFYKMEAIAKENNLFYCYFDIDFSTVIGMTTNIVNNKVRWIEARPSILKKNVDDSPTGFINPNELPPEN